jgi:hypothetical protein
MIDQTATTYDAPAQYLPKLIEWAETLAGDAAASASEQRQNRCLKNAQDYEAIAATYRRIAQWATTRLADICELSLDDAEQLAEINALTRQINDEPPVPLVDLTAWLRAKLEPWFPGLSSEGWQAIAYVLHVWRPQ